MIAEAIDEMGATSSSSVRAKIASRCKARAANSTLQAGREAVQMHGAMGFSDESDVGLYLKRALVLLGLAWRRRPPSPPLGSARSTGSGLKGNRMDWNALDDEDFRREVRSFIEANLPNRLRNHPHRIPRWEETKDWYLTLAQKGWLAPNWPREYGGMGLGPAKLLIFTAEVERAGIPRLYDMGLFMLGPILIRNGTEEQKKTYLPKILSGEHRWAQGYSEPNAGSDLASLRTRAEIVNAGFIVNGHKTWSTFLDDATHIFLLARTQLNSDASKRESAFYWSILPRRACAVG